MNSRVGPFVLLVAELARVVCSGVYYRAGFQGNNIVYIVSVP